MERLDPYLDRREALRSTVHLALGGILGSLLASSSGCRGVRIYQDSPAIDQGMKGPVADRDARRFVGPGPPTAYTIDPGYCTHNGDCIRVCPAGAIGFTEESKGKEPESKQDDPESKADEPECRDCWINIDLCAACGRCFRVCPDNAIVPCYGPDKIPARELKRAPKKA